MNNLLLRRRMMMQAGGSPTPPPTTYQYVEYIQTPNNGTACIVLPITTADFDTIDIQFEALSVNFSVIYGQWGSGNYGNSFECYIDSNKMQVNPANAIYYVISTLVPSKFRIVAETDLTANRTASLYDGNNNLLQQRNRTYSIANNYNISLFCVRKSYYNNNDNVKFISATFSLNNIIVAQYLPCYRINDNIKGVHDIVNDDFRTNDGTGDFILGPDIN